MLEYIPYVFRKDEITQHFNNDKQLSNWLSNKTKSKTIKKVRNGLYVFEANSPYAYSTKFEIASKITSDSYVAYHSALEFYGLGNQRFNLVYVCSSSRFNDFEFEGIDYVHKRSKVDIEIIKRSDSETRVTSLERTIIDCIENIPLAGGIEELLHALTDVQIVDEDSMLDVLNSYNSIILYQKCGYILEHFKQQMSLSDHFFDVCKSKLTNQIKYFLNNEYDAKDLAFNAKWNLVAPTNLLSIISEDTYGIYEE